MKGVKLDHVACAVKKIENCFGLVKKLSGIPLKGKNILNVITCHAVSREDPHLFVITF